MPNTISPVIGDWYHDLNENQSFEVVANDFDDDTIELQFFSGEIEEIDTEIWRQLRLIEIAPPEDWSGPFELEKDDLNYTDEPHHPEDWAGPINNQELDDIIERFY